MSSKVGEVGLGADIDEEADVPDHGWRLRLFNDQDFDVVDGHGRGGAVNIDPQGVPVVRANVGAGFVAAVGILLAEPVELPVGVGEVLNSALVPGMRRVGLSSV